MRFLNNLFKKPALLVLACLSVNFVAATVVSTSPPSSEVKVQSYDYSGSTFSGKIYVSFFLLKKIIQDVKCFPPFFIFVDQKHCLCKDSQCHLLRCF